MLLSQLYRGRRFRIATGSKGHRPWRLNGFSLEALSGTPSTTKAKQRRGGDVSSGQLPPVFYEFSIPIYLTRLPIHHHRTQVYERLRLTCVGTRPTTVDSNDYVIVVRRRELLLLGHVVRLGSPLVLPLFRQLGVAAHCPASLPLQRNAPRGKGLPDLQEYEVSSASRHTMSGR